jgi:hypothetical protein
LPSFQENVYSIALNDTSLVIFEKGEDAYYLLIPFLSLAGTQRYGVKVSNRDYKY